MTRLLLEPAVAACFSDSPDLFATMMTLHGEVYRELEGRRTIRFSLEGKSYFIKQHRGVGWKEIIKNLFQLRWPVVSAKNEYIALTKCKELGILVPETVGYGCRGGNPATRQSFILTRELPASISLEDFCKPWNMRPPSFRLKRALIKKVAHIARRLHENGVNHRDFYLCHFLLETASLATADLRLHLIDLHRAEVRDFVPERWKIKDLAGLYFSSKEICLSQSDIFYFIIEYCNAPLGRVLDEQTSFWRKVKQRGDKLYGKQTRSSTGTDVENSPPGRH